MSKVLLLEGINPIAKKIFEEAGFEVDLRQSALEGTELVKALREVKILGLRSKTQITKEVIAQATSLEAVGAFCIGTNQIDLDTATKHCLPVFNAPFSNSRSVVEMVMGEIICLLRQLPKQNTLMHAGRWQKSAKGSYELRGKKLGIVGYGNIGSQLSVLAENLGLDVYYFDVAEKLALGNATKCQSLEELLSIADIVSLHVDGRPENTNFFNEGRFEQMKQDSYLLNLSRGSVVDLQALKQALDSNRIAGAALDVFPREPKSNEEIFESELRDYDNVILTPHIGGSTQEAQANIAHFVPNQILNYLQYGETALSVNFPRLTPNHNQTKARFVHIHQNQPGMLAQINSILANNKVNIEGQELRTNEVIGYVLTDTDRSIGLGMLDELGEIPGTLKVRAL